MNNLTSDRTHQITETSLNAFDNQNKSGKRVTDKERIYALLIRFRDSEPFTREGIAVWLKLKESTTTGRINDLLNEGWVSVAGVRGGKELLRANIEPVPYSKPFRFTKNNVAELIKMQTGKSLNHCKLIVDEFVRNG